MTTLPMPTRILIFGAAGHIGGPATEYIKAHSPATLLRLATHSKEKAEALAAANPGAEVIVADYFDSSSLASAFDGVDRVLMIIPDWSDDQTATTNLVDAAEAAGSIRQIVRIVGDPPNVHSDKDVSEVLRNWGGGTAIQHQQARRILEDSELPVTFVNIAAYFMDDFLTMFAPPLFMHRMLTLPFDHRMAFIDTTDIGEVCGALLTSTDARHVGKTYNLDNGHDVMMFSEVAELLGDVLGEKIAFDDTPEKFLELNGDIIRQWVGRDDAAEYYIEYFRWERDQSTMWRKTDVVEYFLGRPATTLRSWFEKNKQLLVAPSA